MHRTVQAVATPSSDKVRPAIRLPYGLAPVQPVSAPVVGVLLACAGEDTVSVLPLLPRLSSLGMDPRVIGGIDSGPDALCDAVQAASEPTLVVICTSPSLGSSVVHAAVEAFAQTRRRNHRLLVIELERGRPHRSVGAVRRGAEDLRRQLAAPATVATGLEGYMRVSDCDPAIHGERRVAGGVDAVLPNPPTPVVIEASRRVKRVREHHVAPPRRRPALRLVTGDEVDQPTAHAAASEQAAVSAPPPPDQPARADAPTARTQPVDLPEPQPMQASASSLASVRMRSWVLMGLLCGGSVALITSVLARTVGL